MSASKLSIEQWPVERLLPYPRNARVCPEAAIAKVAGSIHEFGFRNPILVDGEGVIIAGHTRLLAAQRLELEWSDTEGGAHEPRSRGDREGGRGSTWHRRSRRGGADNL